NLLSLFLLNDQFIASLSAGSCLQSSGVLAVPGTRLTSGRFSFTTTHRMIHGVHGYATYPGTNPPPNITSCLAHSLQTMVAVRNHTHGRITVDQDLSEFAGRHFKHCVLFFLVC